MTKAKIQMLAAMLIFGSIGVLVRGIGLPSSVIALTRGVIGALFLLLAALILKRKPSIAAIRKNIGWLAASGAALGANWIFLFEAYRYTTIANATVCYYVAPVLVVLLSPWLLHERLSLRGAACVAVSLAGVALVSGVFPPIHADAGSLRGIFCGLCAALLYAAVMLFNKFLKDIDAMDATILQLASASAVLLPYVLATVPAEGVAFTGGGVWLLLTAGIVHTGLAYLLYFSALRRLKGQTAALMSYIDPVTAVLFSVLLLGEPLSLPQAVGAVMILGAALIGQQRRTEP